MSRKHQFLPAMLMVGGLLAGCASPQMSRIDANRALYETWPLDVKQAVLDGKVEPGMTPDMVEVAWGHPSEKMAGNADEEVWIYRRGGSSGTILPMGGPTIGMGGSMGGIGIQTGGGGTTIGTTGGIGIGGGGIGMGSGIGMGGMGTGPVMVSPPTPPDEREVVFRNGVVYRADPPFGK